MTRLQISCAVVLVLVGCNPSPPTSFGVNLTVNVGAFDTATRTTIASAILTVTGDQAPYSRPVDIVKALRSGAARFRYIPLVHSGELTFQLDAQDASGTTIASGSSGPITIVDRKAVAAVIMLGGANELPDMTTPPDLPGSTPKQQGEHCSVNSDCSSQFCADGYCCNEKCDGVCSVCNSVGKEGICIPVAAGGAPASGHGQCASQPPSNCGYDGTCDGMGKCHNWSLGTVCKPSTCVAASNQFVAASICDGSGLCHTPQPQTCAPYVCKDNMICNSTCTAGGNQCSSGNVCNSGSCGVKLDGADCSVNSECGSGKCVDGVCCKTDCPGPCQTCNQPQARGTCTIVATQGQDPRMQCPVATGNDAACRPGGCDGKANQCLTAAAGTACGGGCAGTVPHSYQCAANGSCSLDIAGNQCPICQTCSAAATSAACVNVPNTTVCAPSYCSDTSTVVLASKCMDGVCPPQGPVNHCGSQYRCTSFSWGYDCPPNDCGSCDPYCQTMPTELCWPHDSWCVSGSCNGNCVVGMYGSYYLCN